MQTNYTEETQPLWRLLEEPGFHFVPVEYNDRALVRQLRLEADRRFPHIRQRTLSGVQTTYQNIIGTFQVLQKGIVWITDFDLLLDNQYAYPELNNRRDLLAEKEISLVVFLPKSAQGLLKMTQCIPDLWSFRNLTLDLISEHPQEYPGTDQGLTLATHSTSGSSQAIAAPTTTELSQHIQQEKEAEYQSLQKRIKALDSHEVDLRILWLLDLAVLATELRYFEEALARYEELLTHANNQQDEAYCWIGMGNVYANKTQYRQAIDWYLKALPVLEANADANVDVQLATLYNELGNSHYNLSKLDKAIDNYEKALAIWMEVYGEEHPNVATAYNNLGSAYQSKGDSIKAIMYYNKALAIGRPILGESHPDMAIWYNNLGEAYRSKDELDKAIGYFQKSLLIFINTLGNEHPNTTTVYSHLKTALKEQGRKKPDEYIKRWLKSAQSKT